MKTKLCLKKKNSSHDAQNTDYNVSEKGISSWRHLLQFLSKIQRTSTSGQVLTHLSKYTGSDFPKHIGDFRISLTQTAHGL